MIFELSEQRRKKAGPKDGDKSELTGIHLVTKPCLVKIIVGNRYILIKCLSLAGTLNSINKVLRQWERGTGNIGEENLYYHLLKYISRTNQEQGTVEILLETKDAYKLLVAEQTALDEARKDPECLNNNTDAYIPYYNELTGKNGWIDPTVVLRFHAWKKTRKKKGKKAAQ
jgi:hypothetical protein